MTFDINSLCGLEYDDAEPLLEDYITEIIKLFKVSPDGVVCFEKYPDGEWCIEQLIHFGIGYEGVSLPEMRSRDIRSILEELFPRKVGVQTKEEAAVIVPVLQAFWKFLEREFKLRHAPSILKYLAGVEPDFPSMMMDTSRFGMAKSLLWGGLKAGFDMTNKTEIQDFMLHYNQNIAPQLAASNSDPVASDSNFRAGVSKVKRDKAKKKRAMQKASRRRNR